MESRDNRGSSFLGGNMRREIPPSAIPIFADDDSAEILIKCSKREIPGKRTIWLKEISSINIFDAGGRCVRLEIVARWDGSEHDLEGWD